MAEAGVDSLIGDLGQIGKLGDATNALAQRAEGWGSLIDGVTAKKSPSQSAATPAPANAPPSSFFGRIGGAAVAGAVAVAVLLVWVLRGR